LSERRADVPPQRQVAPGSRLGACHLPASELRLPCLPARTWPGPAHGACRSWTSCPSSHGGLPGDVLNVNKIMRNVRGACGVSVGCQSENSSVSPSEVSTRPAVGRGICA
jgi:hypothetical protein